MHTMIRPEDVTIDSLRFSAAYMTGAIPRGYRVTPLPSGSPEVLKRAEQHLLQGGALQSLPDEELIISARLLQATLNLWGAGTLVAATERGQCGHRAAELLDAEILRRGLEPVPHGRQNLDELLRVHLRPTASSTCVLN